MSEVQENDARFIELPDDWKPDAPTLEFIAVLVTRELQGLGEKHGVLAKGSDRHTNMGRMQGLASIASLCINMRNEVNDGTFGQTNKEPVDESRIIVP
jgi:hypothetical protein